MIGSLVSLQEQVEAAAVADGSDSLVPTLRPFAHLTSRLRSAQAAAGMSILKGVRVEV